MSDDGERRWSRRSLLGALGLGALALGGARPGRRAPPAAGGEGSAPGSGSSPGAASTQPGATAGDDRPAAGGRPTSPHPQEGMRTRPIPSTGEEIPVVGLGTWQTFDVDPTTPEGRHQREVLRLFVERGGRVIDSSPMYGRSEEVVGALAAELGVADRLWYATKVWSRGEASGVGQMERSFERLGVGTMDLMQIHNLVDWRTHLTTLRRWKEAGRVRYVGVTHYRADAYDALASILRSEPVDFVQLNYNMAVRDAEDRLLPLAADRGVAVLVNRPYRGGSLFRAVRGVELPGWAAENGMASWGRFFLKYLLGHPAVTCVIPATSDPDHLLDNVGAGYGPLPDDALRRRMVRLLEGA